MKFSPFPEITSQRLILRNILESDGEEILFLRSDKTINKYIERPESRATKHMADAIKFIKELHENIENNTSITWGITLKNESRIIGTICLWNFYETNNTAEVGYDLSPEFHSKGIMSEALRMIIDFGFKELKLDKIEAFTHKDNEPSKKLLERKGFRLLEDRRDMDNEFNSIFQLEND